MPKKRDCSARSAIGAVDRAMRTSPRCAVTVIRRCWHAQSVQRGCGARSLARSAKQGTGWLQNTWTTALRAAERAWVLDMDSTVKTLYGHQEGAEVGYNPHKPASSHATHLHAVSLRLILRVDVLPATNITLHMQRWPVEIARHWGWRANLLRGDKSWGIERVMARASKIIWRICPLRMTVNVKRDLERAMRHSRADAARLAGQGDDAAATRLERNAASSCCAQAGRDLAITEQANPAQPRLTFARSGRQSGWEYAPGHLARSRNPDPRAVVSGSS